MQAATATARQALPTDPAKLRQAAEKFEAQAIAEMLKPMFETIDTSKGFGGGGAGEAAFRPMLIEQYAKSMAGSGGIGIAQAMMTQLLRAQEGPPDALPARAASVDARTASPGTSLDHTSNEARSIDP